MRVFLWSQLEADASSDFFRTTRDIRCQDELCIFEFDTIWVENYAFICRKSWFLASIHQNACFCLHTKAQPRHVWWHPCLVTLELHARRQKLQQINFGSKSSWTPEESIKEMSVFAGPDFDMGRNAWTDSRWINDKHGSADYFKVSVRGGERPISFLNEDIWIWCRPVTIPIIRNFLSSRHSKCLSNTMKALLRHDFLSISYLKTSPKLKRIPIQILNSAADTIKKCLRPTLFISNN